MRINPNAKQTWCFHLRKLEHVSNWRLKNVTYTKLLFCAHYSCLNSGRGRSPGALMSEWILRGVKWHLVTKREWIFALVEVTRLRGRCCIENMELIQRQVTRGTPHLFYGHFFKYLISVIKNGDNAVIHDDWPKIIWFFKSHLD